MEGCIGQIQFKAFCGLWALWQGYEVWGDLPVENGKWDCEEKVRTLPAVCEVCERSMCPWRTQVVWKNPDIGW